MFCKKCGTQIIEGAKFCRKCGTAINQDIFTEKIDEKTGEENTFFEIVDQDNVIPKYIPEQKQIFEENSKTIEENYAPLQDQVIDIPTDVIVQEKSEEFIEKKLGEIIEDYKIEDLKRSSEEYTDKNTENRSERFIAKKQEEISDEYKAEKSDNVPDKKITKKIWLLIVAIVLILVLIVIGITLFINGRENNLDESTEESEKIEVTEEEEEESKALVLQYTELTEYLDYSEEKFLAETGLDKEKSGYYYGEGYDIYFENGKCNSVIASDSNYSVFGYKTNILYEELKEEIETAESYIEIISWDDGKNNHHYWTSVWEQNGLDITTDDEDNIISLEYTYKTREKITPVLENIRENAYIIKNGGNYSFSPDEYKCLAIIYYYNRYGGYPLWANWTSMFESPDTLREWVHLDNGAMTAYSESDFALNIPSLEIYYTITTRDGLGSAEGYEIIEKVTDEDGYDWVTFKSDLDMIEELDRYLNYPDSDNN